MARTITSPTEAAAELARRVERAGSVVFFGGAGVSTASGIPDFRSADGLYHQHFDYPPETMLSHSFYQSHTKEFYDFYRAHMVYPDAEPNACHRYLYKLEKQDKLRAIVTQNIDGLHKKAGNKRVYELHGSIYENYCVQCETEYPLEKIMETDGVPRCDKCGGIIKPWVVLYGEAPDKYTMIGACREISGADLMIVAGTSLSVEPAASLIGYFSGRDLAVINKEATPADEKASLVIRDDVESVFKALMEK